MEHRLSWVEVSRSNLTHNIQTFRGLIGKDRILCPAVKGNAYGHGLTVCAPVMVAAGADWLGVNALFEAVSLREAGVKVPIYIMGYIALDELSFAVEQGFRFVAYNLETLQKLAEVTKKLGVPALTHLKVETGTHRQGVHDGDLEKIFEFYRSHPLIKLEGVAAHFANIEDTTDHSYAEFQLQNFKKLVEKIQGGGFSPKYIHTANTAAAILFPKTYFTMVRSGVGNYGLWPSRETFVSAVAEGKNVELRPVMTWKTTVAQVKKVPTGAFIGYGCTYQTKHDTVIAVLPVGYYDGYDRRLSNRSEVLIRGKRAPICGRVFMNMIVVDVTDIPGVQVEDEVVLLGRQGGGEISAEQLAEWMGTINYEVTTRISESMERRLVD